jgi:hypothetical protein
MNASPRRPRSLLLLSLLSLSACGGGSQPPPDSYPPPTEKPLATLQGQLAVGSGTELNGPVRLALAWYPALLSEGSGPVSRPAGIVTEGVAYPGRFPANYTFDVKSAPPAEALVQLGDGMRGKGAVGILLAYSDRNGNGALDTIPADGTPVDRVMGASLSWTQPPAFMVVYLDSAQAPATGMKQGFNLVRLTDNLTTHVVPLTTAIPLTLHDDPMLDAFVCEAAWDDIADQAPCGLPGDEPIEGTLTFGGEILIHGTGADVSLEVYRDGQGVEAAQVTVGDHTARYDAALGRYTLHLEDTSELNAGLVTVMAKQGDAVVARTVQVPSDFQVTWPTTPMSYSPGAEVRAAWTQSHGVSDYEVSLVVGDQVLASELTRERWLTFSAGAYEGPAVVRVGVSAESEGLVVRRVREVPVSFTPCDTVTEGSGLTVEGVFEQYARGILDGESNEVRVEVKDDAVAVTDAKVVVGDFEVPYLNAVGAYHNVIFTMGGGSVFGDSTELRVMRGNEVLCRTLTLPGDYGLTLHGEPERSTGSPLAVSWTRAPGAVRYDLWLGTMADPSVFYSASTNELEYTFEQVDAVGNLTLRIGAVSHPVHNDTLGWMDVKRLRLGGATFTGVTTAN